MAGETQWPASSRRPRLGCRGRRTSWPCPVDGSENYRQNQIHYPGRLTEPVTTGRHVCHTLYDGRLGDQAVVHLTARRRQGPAARSWVWASQAAARRSAARSSVSSCSAKDRRTNWWVCRRCRPCCLADGDAVAGSDVSKGIALSTGSSTQSDSPAEGLFGLARRAGEW